AAENRILKAQLKGRPKLSDAERATLGEIGHRLGRKVLGEVANVARPDTILAWYRKLIARKFDGSKTGQASDDYTRWRCRSMTNVCARTPAGCWHWARAAYPRRRSSNANGLCGQNSAWILGIRASFQRDNLRRRF